MKKNNPCMIRIKPETKKRIKMRAVEEDKTISEILDDITKETENDLKRRKRQKYDFGL